MPSICFEFSGHKFWFTEEDLLRSLNSINPFIKNKHKENRDILIKRWSNIVKKVSNYFSFTDDYYYYVIKELLFFYCIKDEMVNSNVWIPLDVPHLTQFEISKLKERAKFYGEFRYDVDNGWLGVLAQDLFRNYIESLGFSYQENDLDFEGAPDDFDLLIKNIKLDVKCATQSNYVEITPKVRVEEDKIKDYYVAMKYFKNLNQIIILGYFDHNDLGLYPFKVLYGTPYWGVKLYSAKPFSHLLGILNND